MVLKPPFGKLEFLFPEYGVDSISDRLTNRLTFDRPFPALTPAQRYHLDVLGYVVVPNTLSTDEVSRIKDALFRLKDELGRLDDPSQSGPRVRGACFVIDQPCHHYIGNIIEADPATTAYATHPRMVAMAEELIGGEARIVQIDAHINRRGPDEGTHEFHRGTDIPFATHTYQGLFHCSFVKTLTNLTDLGPDDGGTVVIAGSHKVDVAIPEFVKMVRDDPSLIHQVVAPAGSTLLFSEALIHASGRIRTDTERVVIVTGYGTTLFPNWGYGQISDAFRRQIPEQLKILIDGRDSHRRGIRYRTLSMPADERRFELGEWNQRPPSQESF